ncbi:hypothetical protein LOAG_15059 [Loa loa]|uniref:Uncharacterized protein n=1 Tax=Loa loa TaxID=7209 RepID=A0A1S0TGI2_LOALO|nr:hypothetical protein LOAG_15059 [Loa loa]EFO13468.1 hypothetical protein LOAG_15059 [Loa loa]
MVYRVRLALICSGKELMLLAIIVSLYNLVLANSCSSRSLSCIKSGDSVHVAADMTEMLLRAVIMDKETKNDDWFNIGNVKLAYCTAIISSNRELDGSLLRNYTNPLPDILFYKTNFLNGSQKKCCCHAADDLRNCTIGADARYHDICLISYDLIRYLEFFCYWKFSPKLSEILSLVNNTDCNDGNGK